MSTDFSLPDPILIAEPEAQARKTLVALYEAQGVKAVGAKSLREARDLLQNRAIAFCLVAGPLADLFEFEAFQRDCNCDYLFTYGLRQRQAAQPPHLQSPKPAALKTVYERAMAGHLSPKAAASASVASELIVIGASTGGISALEQVLRDFPEDCPPTLIVQHMRDGFAEGMVARFDQMLRPRVSLAPELQPLRRGRIYIAAGNGRHLYPLERNGEILSALLQAPPLCGHCPSVDLLFRKAAGLAKRHRIAAALLTGMGNDGAEGLALLRAAGAHTLAQDEATSVVWGMPRAAIELGAACEILPLSRIAAALLAPHWGETLRLGQSA